MISRFQVLSTIMVKNNISNGKFSGKAAFIIYTKRVNIMSAYVCFKTETTPRTGH